MRRGASQIALKSLISLKIYGAFISRAFVSHILHTSGSYQPAHASKKLPGLHKCRCNDIQCTCCCMCRQSNQLHISKSQQQNEVLHIKTHSCRCRFICLPNLQGSGFDLPTCMHAAFESLNLHRNPSRKQLQEICSLHWESCFRCWMVHPTCILAMQ